MVNLRDIQERLNHDPAEMATFLSDPIGYLQKEGLVLSEEMQQELMASLKRVDPAKPKIILGIISNHTAGLWEQ